MEETIIDKQRKIMLEKGFDTLVAISVENVAYTAGVEIPSQSLTRQRHAICLVPFRGEPKMIVVNMEESLAKSNSRIKDIRSYNEFTENPMDLLVDAIKECGLDRSRIGIELDYLPAKDYLRLKDLLPGAQFIDCGKLFSKMRMIKTKEEINLLRQAGKAAEKAQYLALSKLKPGMAELDLASFVVSSLFSEGIDSIKPLVLGAGNRCWHANPGPTKYNIKLGDMIRMGISGLISGYFSDVARTAVVGKPTVFMKDTWSKLIESRAIVLDLIKPGSYTQDIYFAFSNKFKKLGLEPIDFVGHGIGLTIHEEPYISKFSNTTLEEGMVLGVEPYYMLPEKQMGFQIEDEVIVTSQGYELITNYKDPSDLIVVD